MQHLKRMAKNRQLNRRGRISNFYQVGEERGIAHAALKKKKKDPLIFREAERGNRRI